LPNVPIDYRLIISAKMGAVAAQLVQIVVQRRAGTVMSSLLTDRTRRTACPMSEPSLIISWLRCSSGF